MVKVEVPPSLRVGEEEVRLYRTIKECLPPDILAIVPGNLLKPGLPNLVRQFDRVEYLPHEPLCEQLPNDGDYAKAE